ncbi:HAD-IC family P-type ATPase [Halomonas sp. MCCC 1A17488]|uniref:cation-translocating P-type ATPase n=1 Tax=unclassified Halomonas TaxID=2609666 RepID=UPI0018D2651F|nr:MULTISPECIES: HAD-IC family P-type ATPase [unclassified Halomonas]MCE8015274.1 HAD-IC family P-type ATPase [Halomonas sp. MCCC 1A17488]MCG3238607.1 HAD-IC family P-type ATPase [Halomonas sp. MCCC 1A17488]QPP51415.1 HAD-IC family P-type ATPase [Halomonas sp. SS10-MC5]
MPVQPTPSRPPWHAVTGDQALATLESHPEGLASEAADARLAEHGPNRLREQAARPGWKRLLEQFNNLLMLILIVAAIASLALGHRLDALAIVGVVTIIALIGFVQEGKAEHALESIRGMLSPQAKVLRDGRRQTVPAETLVPGDIVLLESGDRVPADLRLLQANRLRTEEAALTGESVAVDKQAAPVDEATDLAERSSMAYASTLVAQGTAQGIVVATGIDTEIGRISEMLRGVEKLKTPLLRQLDRAGRVLAIFILGAAAITAAIGALVHDQPVSEMFMAAVGLAVAAIPEGLPAIVTIGLALGVQAMARRNAIIRRLPAVETLGSISTIFTDKTGTLTRNEMTAQAIWLPKGEIAVTGVGFAPEGEFLPGGDDTAACGPLELDAHPALRHFLKVGVLCNDAELARDEAGAWHIHGDPTEGALVVAAAKAGLDVATLRGCHDRHDAIPFESERKYMATLHEVDGQPTLMVKGAPDRLLEMCHRVRTEAGDVVLDTSEWEQRIHALSARGLRVLALAEKPIHAVSELDETHAEEGLVLLGLVGLLDPPREEAVRAVSRCLSAGIRPIMVTGDHAVTALAIARQLGFANTERALTGREVEAMSDAELERCIDTVDVFARAAPEHKLRLVKAMQARGGICAMTGDGVNDGPALKRADVGVAMGIQGTEAAKEAAEMVLADDNFATIVGAIEEGRKVYDNIRKTITFLLPTNGAQGLAIMLAVLAGTLLPITPLQALWVNMVVAVTLGLALAFEPGEENLMRRRPRDPAAALLDLFLLWRVVFVSLLLLIAVFGMFSWLLRVEGNEAVARAGAVNALVMGSAAYLINSRYLLRSNLSWQGLFGSRPVWIAIGLVLLLQLAWTYLPFMQAVFDSAALDLRHWLLVIGCGVALFLVVELEKWLLRRNARAAKKRHGGERPRGTTPRTQ